MYDLFISYSHLDNAKLPPHQEGWVDSLHDYLQSRVPEYCGFPIKIFRDLKIRRDEELDDGVFQNLERSQLLLCVVSPGFCTSKWCPEEVERFRKRRGKGHIFKATKIQVALEEQPAPLKGLLDFAFFREARDGRLVAFDTPAHPEWSPQADRLAQDIAGRLKELRTDQPKGSEAVSGEAIYLARSGSDQEVAFREFKDDLEAKGYRVVTLDTIPETGQECQVSVEQLLRNCRASVHPVGRSPGMTPEESEPVVHLQANLARSRCSDDPSFRCIFWMAPGSLRNDPSTSHREFLEKLTQERHFYEMEPERFKTELESCLRPQQTNTRVFVALTGSDLKQERKWLCEALVGEGLEVLPKQMPESHEALRDEVSRCAYSVHLVGSKLGVTLEGETEPIVKLQLDVVREELSPEKVLCWGQSEPTFGRRLVGELNSLPRQILQYLSPQPTEEAGAADRIVYLIHHQRDRGDDANGFQPFREIHRYLTHDCGFIVLEPAFEGDQAELRLLHERNFACSHGLLLFWGRVSEVAFRLQQTELLSGNLQARPLAICLADPESPAKSRFDPPGAEVDVARCFTDFDPSHLERFVQEIRRR